MSGVRATVKDLTIGGEEARGGVLVFLPMGEEVFIDDQLTATCKLKRPEPFNGFPYDQFLATKGVYALCTFPSSVAAEAGLWTWRGGLYRARILLMDRFNRLLPEPHSSFVTGLILGGSSGLSDDLQDTFSRTGTSHILAASGFNVSLFTFFFFAFAIERFGRRRGIFMTGVLVVVYVFLAGATAAVIRAGIMAGIVLLAEWVRRPRSPMRLLAFALPIMLLLNPFVLLVDPGFQLSFVATAAVLFIPDHLEGYFSWMPEVFGLREALVGSLVASLVTAPIMFWHFGSISLIAPVVNVFVLPLVPLLMAVGLILLPMAFLLPASILAYLSVPAVLLSSMILWVIRQGASVPHAVYESVDPHTAAIVSAFCLILIFLWLFKPRVDALKDAANSGS